MTAHPHIPKLDRYGNMSCHCGKVLQWHAGRNLKTDTKDIVAEEIEEFSKSL